jgi:5'-nucleotidase
MTLDLAPSTITASGARLALAATLALMIAGCVPVSSSRSPEAQPVTVKLIALNDFHGQLSPPGGFTSVTDRSAPERGRMSLPTGGAAYLASLVAQLKAVNPMHAVVAAGDLVGGSPLESALFHDEPAIEAMNAIGLEYSSVGNHEFDDGIRELVRLQAGGCHSTAARTESCVKGAFEGAKFTYLAANVLDAQTGKPVFPASAVKTLEANGREIQVGFIGAVLKGTPDIVIPAGVKGLSFTDEADAVNAAVPELLAKGADVIVLLIHEGAVTSSNVFDDESCPDLRGDILPIADRLDPVISVIVSGHTHRAYICQRHGRLLTSAGSQGRFVTDIDLTFDSSGKMAGATARQLAVVNDRAPNPLPQKYPTLAASRPLSELVAFYTKAAAPLTERVVATIASDITREATSARESALGNLIADAQLAATSAPENGGAQIAFMNAAGIRADLIASDGNVTFGEIHAIHPFGNALTTLTLTGRQLHALLEQQWQGASVLQVSEGFTYEWSSEASPGSKVDPNSIRLNGKPLAPDARYRITVNEFLAGGGDGFKVLTQGTERRQGVTDAEALERYLASHAPVEAPAPGRIRRR